MRIGDEGGRNTPPRVVDYVRSAAGAPVRDMIITPYDQILSVEISDDEVGLAATLFQLPRTDNFLRTFARMAYVADAALKDTLKEMLRLSSAQR
jgi:hypothetical protein